MMEQKIKKNWKKTTLINNEKESYENFKTGFSFYSNFIEIFHNLDKKDD